MGTIALCSKDLEFRQFMAIMNVDGYKKWFENLEGGEVKNFTKCFDNSVKHSLRMVVCCEEVSEKIMDSIFNLICSEENEHDYNFKCKILHFITRPENKKNLFQIIEMSKICHDMCPLDPPPKKARAQRNLRTIQKRQFDLASTFDTIKQYVCHDVLEDSAIDAWNHILTMFYDNPTQSDQRSSYFLVGMLLRKPACCLLKEDL